MKVKYCTCCGAVMYQRLQQFHNQDIGFAICADCVGMLRRRKDYDPEEFERCYGREGVNYPRVTPHCNECGSTRKDVKRMAELQGLEVENPICCEVNVPTCKHCGGSNDVQATISGPQCASCRALGEAVKAALKQQ